MADIVNLRRARKKKRLKDKERQAAANRAHFGQGKAGRAAREQESQRVTRRLDGKKLEENSTPETDDLE